jgi:phenylalanyl-tRNA synthetase beta subunit
MGKAAIVAEERPQEHFLEKNSIQTGSPNWLKQGLAPLRRTLINNVVDIRNWVMAETGQPVHVFDAKKSLGIN